MILTPEKGKNIELSSTNGNNCQTTMQAYYIANCNWVEALIRK